jgi:hypothetical protein
MPPPPTSYPPISALIPQGWISSGGINGLSFLDQLGAAIDDLEAKLLEPLRYRDLAVETSASHDIGQYRFTLLTEKPVHLALPAGLTLIFFPDTLPTKGSAVGLSFFYEWPIKAYVHDFEIGKNPAEVAFALFLRLADIAEEEFYQRILDILAPSNSDYAWLIGKIKAWDQGFQLTAAGLVAGTEIAQILAELERIDADAYVAAFEAVFQDLGNFDLDQTITRLIDFFRELIGDIDRDDFEKLLLPHFTITIDSLSIAIAFPNTVLRPLDGSDVSKLTFTAGAVTYDTQTGFDVAVDESIAIAFTPSEIGKTGLTLAITGCKLDLSPSYNIPEAIADMRPQDFMGVFCKSVVIGLPKQWFSSASGTTTLAVVGRNLLIGTGGLSGTIGLEALDPVKLVPSEKPTPPPANSELEFILGKEPAASGDSRKGFVLGFSSFDMKFRQNVLLECKIKGSMTIPKFKATPPKLDIELHIAQDGDFNVTATVPGAGYPLEVPNIFIFTAKMLGVGKNDKRVFIQTTGDLSFANNGLIGHIITKPIHIEKLRIYSDGSFEIEGGTIPLPESVVIPLGPAKIAITAIHCGAHEQDHKGVMRKYRYWGFDGGINVDPGGIDARGDGIKYYYTVDDNPDFHDFLRIEGIGIDLVIPGNASKENAALLLKGYLALKDPIYEGSLSFQLPKLMIAGGASMKYYTNVPAWIVHANLELPKPIPLGSTSLGIYGFGGLFGLRFVAAKEKVGLAADASWGDYYRAPPPGISDDKFLPPEKTVGASTPFSIGAGVSLATAPDGGKAFSSQLFLLVSIPNLILLEGRGDVLAKQRVGLTGDEPPYYAYLALSPDSIEIGAGARYRVPKDPPDAGKVLDLNATLEAAFFFHNPSAWYVHFGTKAKPMTARVLSLFDAYAYLMLSASGIEAGTGVHYDFDKHYGPVSVSAHAYLDLWAYLSFERGQAGGGIALGGYVDVKVVGIGFHIEIATGLTVDAPKPFRVAGYVHVCVSVNLRIKKFEKCVDVAFVWVGDTDPNLTQIPVLPTSSTAPPFAAGVHMASGRSYAVHVTDTELVLEAIEKQVPCDTYIDLKFLKPVDPSKVTPLTSLTPLIGGYTNPPSPPFGNVEYIPPKYGWKTVTHSYTLEELRLETWSSNKPGWITYHPFLALAQGALLSAADAAKLGGFPIGAWQKQDTGYSQIRILALTPFNYMEPVGGYRPEEMGLTAATLFCEGTKRTETCVDFNITGRGGGLAGAMVFTAGVDYYRNGLLFRVEGEDTTSVPIGTSVPGQVMLAIKPGSRAILQFPRTVVRCRLAFISGAPSVTLRFQRRKPNAPAAPVSLPEFVDVKTLAAAPNTLTNPIVYDDPAAPIDRVIVEPPAPDNRAIAALQDKIARLRDASPALRDVEALQQQLQAEQGKYCGGSLAGAGPPKGGECATYLYQVCWLAEEDWKFNQTIPGAAAVEANFQTMRDAVEKTIAPIWHPNLAYRIVVTVSDTVTAPDGAAVPHSQTFYVHFRTGAALGHFVPDATIAPLAGDDGRQEIPERLLKFYIDMERSDPDPSGHLLYAKPLYYGAPVLRLFFAKPYAYHFFAEWPKYHSPPLPPPSPPAAAELDPDHYELVMRIKDPAESEPAPNAPDHATPLLTEALTGVQKWSPDPAPRRTEDLKVLSNMRNPRLGGVDPGPTCWVVGGDPMTPAAKGLEVELHDLEPDKLYTAVVINCHADAEAAGGFREAEVHRYPFRTSSYPDFQSHIGSYRLKDEAGNTRPAVFLLSHDLAAAAAAPQTYAAARNILQRIGAADNDSAAYPDFFDRLIHACLKLAPLPPALSLEFNFLRNSLTQGIYGMWIRSPEALNDPRIPQDQLRSAIRMYVGGSELLSPNVLFSKDCCQAFVMTAGAFPSQDVAFAFDHLIWNGKAYAPVATVPTDPFSA